MNKRFLFLILLLAVSHVELASASITDDNAESADCSGVLAPPTVDQTISNFKQMASKFYKANHVQTRELSQTVWRILPDETSSLGGFAKFLGQFDTFLIVDFAAMTARTSAAFVDARPSFPGAKRALGLSQPRLAFLRGRWTREPYLLHELRHLKVILDFIAGKQSPFVGWMTAAEGQSLPNYNGSLGTNAYALTQNFDEMLAFQDSLVTALIKLKQSHRLNASGGQIGDRYWILRPEFATLHAVAKRTHLVLTHLLDFLWRNQELVNYQRVNQKGFVNATISWTFKDPESSKLHDITVNLPMNEVRFDDPVNVRDEALTKRIQWLVRSSKTIEDKMADVLVLNTGHSDWGEWATAETYEPSRAQDREITDQMLQLIREMRHP